MADNPVAIKVQARAPGRGIGHEKKGFAKNARNPAVVAAFRREAIPQGIFQNAQMRNLLADVCGDGAVDTLHERGPRIDIKAGYTIRGRRTDAVGRRLPRAR